MVKCTSERIAEELAEEILSGLNNPAVWTVFEQKYSQYFGFTEEEAPGMAGR